MELNLRALDDGQLVTLAQSADGEAFAELIRRTRPACLRTASLILKDPELAEDQVQTAYLNAWKQIHSFRSEAKFATWISRIVTNQCLMALRSRRNAPVQAVLGAEGEETVVDFRDPAPSVDATMEEEERRQWVRRELRCVPPFLRTAIDLVYFSDVSISDAAQQLGVSVPAFKSRLARARAFLKQRLEKDYAPAQ